MVDVDNLSVTLSGQLVLDKISFCIHSGEFIGLIGPNGAGKTTLVKAILGLLPANQGKISVKKDVLIGYIPQRGSAYDNQVPMNVMEIVKLGSRGNAAKAGHTLQQVNMLTLAKRRFNVLSGGQQQRVLIAKALAANPSLLILDEPTTGIDEQSQTEFYKILASLQATGIAIVMISHDVDTVLKLVTRVICLNQAILYDGLPQHFEADRYLPNFYNQQHRLLHHHHGAAHA